MGCAIQTASAATATPAAAAQLVKRRRRCRAATVARHSASTAARTLAIASGEGLAAWSRRGEQCREVGVVPSVGA